MKESIENDNRPFGDKQRWGSFLGIVFGLFFLGLSWFSFTIPSNGNEWVYAIRIPGLLLGINLIIYPFKEFLKKFFITRILYLILQVVSGIVFILIYAFSLFGRVMIAMIMVFTLSTLLIYKVLEYLEVKNPWEVGLFLAFTISAILFSFKGNMIINWFAIKMEGGNNKKIARDLKIINEFLGQTQIRYLTYFLYFVLIVLFTVLHLVGLLPNENDQNFMFLTLQSFAAFLAFETLVEKRYLMAPWFKLARNFEEGFRKLNQKPIKDIFNDEDK